MSFFGVDKTIMSTYYYYSYKDDTNSNYVYELYDMKVLEIKAFCKLKGLQDRQEIYIIDYIFRVVSSLTHRPARKIFNALASTYFRLHDSGDISPDQTIRACVESFFNILGGNITDIINEDAENVTEMLLNLLDNLGKNDE